MYIDITCFFFSPSVFLFLYHFRKRNIFDANMYFRLKCQMLLHKLHDIITAPHLNLKNVLRLTQIRMMKLMQTGLHQQKNV